MSGASPLGVYRCFPYVSSACRVYYFVFNYVDFVVLSANFFNSSFAISFCDFSSALSRLCVPIYKRIAKLRCYAHEAYMYIV